MLKFAIAMIIFFNTTFLYAEDFMNKENTVIEILTWKAKETVTDEVMIRAVDAMTNDLRNLPGFLQQSLYKNTKDEWVDVYYWTNEEDAHLSNDRMKDKQSLNDLLELIMVETIAMEVMMAKQQSSHLLFAE